MLTITLACIKPIRESPQNKWLQVQSYALSPTPGSCLGFKTKQYQHLKMSIFPRVFVPVFTDSSNLEVPEYLHLIHNLYVASTIIDLIIYVPCFSRNEYHLPLSLIGFLTI